MKTRIRTRRLVLALAALTLAAPVAPAVAADELQPAWTLPADFRAPGDLSSLDRVPGSMPADVTYPGEGIQAPVPSVDPAMPADVTYPGEGIEAPPFQPEPTVVSSTPDGFDFGDAGIGAAVAAAAALLAAAATLAATRRRGPAHS